MEKPVSQTIPFADITEQLCQNLNCSALADDLERVNHAREMLTKLQQNEAFSQLLGDQEPETPAHILQTLLKTRLQRDSPNTSETHISLSEDLVEEPEVIEDFLCNELSEDAWLGFFKGYEILGDDQQYSIDRNKQCIAISHKDCDSSLEYYLRAGVRCFLIDLFQGTELENQGVIFTLRQNELKISREYGFPITSTIIAMLSPRCQYTGVLEPIDAVYEMQKEDVIVLTTDRRYSMKGTRGKVYVNARFLIDDCRQGNFILIGPTLQVRIIDIQADELRCLVMEPGPLRSRLPVRFPGRCNRRSISVEEIEDITFAREVGINILVSCTPGTLAYLEDLNNVLSLLNCQHLRLCSRVVLNEIYDDGPDLQWVAERYDGFIIDFSPQQQADKCIDKEDLEIQPDVLKLSSMALDFIEKAFKLQKPIIMNATLIGDQKLFVHPCHIPEIFLNPDKFLFKCDHIPKWFYFNLLQNALLTRIPEMATSAQPYCDQSDEGSDSIALSCVAASVESNASAILVCSLIPDMVIKLSHFRPKAPIVYISSSKSTADSISIYHNVIHLYFRAGVGCLHEEYVKTALMYGLLFLKCRKIIRNGQNVIMVYGSSSGIDLPDKYLVYKFDERKFANHLCDILFV